MINSNGPKMSVIVLTPDSYATIRRTINKAMSTLTDMEFHRHRYQKRREQ